MAADMPTKEPLSPSQARAGAADEANQICMDAGSKSLALQLASEAASNTAQRKGRFSLSLRKAKSPCTAHPRLQTPEPSPKTPGASFKSAEPVLTAATADSPSQDFPASPCAVTTTIEF